MRLGLRSDLVAAIGIACAGLSVHSQPAAQSQQSPGQTPPPAQVNTHRASKEQLERWMKELSNWGRWGKDDELGALNLITATKRMQAAALAKTGTVVSLGHDLNTEKAVDVPNPYERRMVFNPDGEEVSDVQNIAFHGGTFSHFDALCHVSYEGQLYNGFGFKETVTADGGCSKLGLVNVADKLVTRGILVDIPRLKGLPYLESGTHVYREDVEAWEKQAGVKISAGDAIFLRTGRWGRRAKLGPPALRAGFDASIAPFLKERDVALLGGDTAHEVGSVPGFRRPMHRLAMVALGVHLFDNLDLEAAAETAAKLKRWEFLLVATPSRVPNATGSPINPVAIF